jgi:hypothetical protein
MNDTITNLIADIRKWEKNAKENSTEPRLAEVGSALVSVLDPIATRLEQLVKDGFYVAPEAARKFTEEQSKKAATPIDPNGPTLNQVLMNPPFKAEAELAKKRGLVGNCVNNRHIMSWNYSDELDIVSRATGNAEGNEWDFFLEELGRVRAQGTVYGGRWLATRLAKAMRNGMTSYRKHRRKSSSNRAARKSAELAVAAKEEK